MKRLLLGALALVTLVVALLTGLTLMLGDDDETPTVAPELAADGTYRAGSVPGRDRDAVQAAVDAVPLALSYDYADLDRSLTSATSRMTEAFAEEFRTTFETTVRPLATDKQAVSQARVRAAGVVEQTGKDAGDAVIVLVYVDQVLVSSRVLEREGGGAQAEQPVKVGQTRVTVRMVRVGDSWKVDELRPL